MHAAAPPTDDLDAVILAELSDRRIPGLSLAIIRDGGIEARAYGVATHGGPRVTTATLFQAASISKLVAAVGALTLVEQGRLSLDDDVNVWLKSWKVPDDERTRTGKVTLRRLLSHTSGLTVHGFPGYPVEAHVPSLLEVLDGAGNTAPVRADVTPGSLSRYSGGGYTVLQALVSDVTGVPFAEFMEAAVLEPLGMIASTYEQPLPAGRAGDAASGHSAGGSMVRGRWHVYPELAAAGLWTTPADLARFAIALQQSLAGTSTRGLSQAMTRHVLTDQGGGFGLGPALGSRGDARLFGHGGRNEGFDALALAFADAPHGLVLMLNANDNSGFMDDIVGRVAGASGWPARSTIANGPSIRDD